MNSQSCSTLAGRLRRPLMPLALACGLALAAAARAETASPWFTLASAATSLTGVVGRNASVADVNGDGYPDLLLHLPLNEAAGDVLNKQFLYLNQANPAGGRRFVDVTATSGIRANRRGTAEGRHSSLAIFADVNNDGNLDMFSGVYAHRIDDYPDRGDRNDLYLGDGRGHFTLATTSRFHTEPLYNTAGGVFLDYDRDGRIDLFIANWYGPGDTLSESFLYRGEGSGGFQHANASAGLAGNRGAIYASSAADYNRDGYPDLFVPTYGWTVEGQQSTLWENNRNGTFGEAQSRAMYGTFEGYGSGVAAFGSMPRDFDNDGWPDLLELLVHGQTGLDAVRTTVMVNRGGVFSWNFNALSREGGTATEDLRDHYGSWFDFNNDGLPDLVITRCCNGGSAGNWISLYQQLPDHTFIDVTDMSGLGAINANPVLRPHNVIPLDYDQDGAEDLLVGFADGGQPVMLWHNEVGRLNRSLAIRLRGSGRDGGSNTAAIGARVEVTANGVTQVQTVDAGPGQFGPQRPLAMTFGLGTAGVADTVKVTWPNRAGTVTTLTAVRAGQALVINESLDFNGDACVDRRDLELVLAQTTNPAANLLYDTNGDGRVNVADARVVVNAFSRPNGAPCR